jgi:hypothetical protein
MPLIVNTGVERMTLANNHLTQLGSANEGGGELFATNMTKLVMLDLSGNALTVLKDSNVFSNVLQLHLLILSDNDLSVIGGDIFRKMDRLTALDLSGNQLTALEHGIFDSLIKLIVLSLQNNMLTILHADVFNKLNELKTLSLKRNKLAALETGVFASLTKLLALYLQDNKLTTLDTIVFNKLGQLQELYLESNALNALDPQLFSGSPQLLQLTLQNNRLTVLDPLLFVNTTFIKRLDLSQNKLSAVNVHMIDAFTRLDSFSIAENNISFIHGILKSKTVLHVLEMEGNPSRCWLATPTHSQPNDAIVCECAAGYTSSQSYLCAKTDATFLIPPAFASLRGPFKLVGPADQFAAQKDQMDASLAFDWNDETIRTPADTSVTLVWDEGSNTTGHFAPYFNLSLEWGEMCTGNRCKSPLGNLTDQFTSGVDYPHTPARIWYNYINQSGDTATEYASVRMVYSAFHKPFQFDRAFQETTNGDTSLAVFAALSRMPHRLRIWENTITNSTDRLPDIDWLPIQHDTAPILLKANPAIPTSITFRLTNNYCNGSRLVVQPVNDHNGIVVGWDVVVGGVDLVALHLKPCTAILQAHDSVTNEVLNMAMVNASVPDCYEVDSNLQNVMAIDPVSLSCNGHGQCSDDADLFDGEFTGCDCDAGYDGKRCGSEISICDADADPPEAYNVKTKECMAFKLKVLLPHERKEPLASASKDYVDPEKLQQDYEVGKTYRISPLKLDERATNVSNGFVPNITYSLAEGAPKGFFVSSTYGEILGVFDEPGDHTVSLIAHDASGLTQRVDKPMIFHVKAKPLPTTIITLSSVIVFLAFIAIAYWYRARQLRLQAFDFSIQLDEMKANGELPDGINSANVPREIKRSAVIVTDKIGSGGFGDVWKGVVGNCESSTTFSSYKTRPFHLYFTPLFS